MIRIAYENCRRRKRRRREQAENSVPHRRQVKRPVNGRVAGGKSLLRDPQGGRERAAASWSFYEITERSKEEQE